MMYSVTSYDPNIQVRTTPGRMGYGGRNPYYHSPYSSSYDGLNNNIHQGMLRFNTNSYRLEMFDGDGWIEVNLGGATVSLSPPAQSAIAWAHTKMVEEMELQHLAKEYESVANLVEEIEEKKSQLAMLKTLLKTEKK